MNHAESHYTQMENIWNSCGSLTEITPINTRVQWQPIQEITKNPQTPPKGMQASLILLKVSIPPTPPPNGSSHISQKTSPRLLEKYSETNETSETMTKVELFGRFECRYTI